MAGSLLKPITVSAKIIAAELPVPSLAGAPFNKESKLEPGVHVHWSLPDSLTRAKLLPKGGTNVAVFPGVPDLWLVIRFNPAPPLGTPGNPKRTWVAWMVDSVLETAKPLSSWVPPPTRDPKLVHTVAGMLPTASALKYPGWGVWESTRTTFDPAIAAYYPASRKRFGFHDPLTGVPKTGLATYVVIGWFADRGYDPLYVAADRMDQLNDWKVSHHLRANGFTELGTIAPMSASAPAGAAWSPATVSMQPQPNPPAARLRDVKRSGARGGTATSQMASLKSMQASFPAPPVGANMPVQASVESFANAMGPKDIICHGSVFSVPLAGSATFPAAIKKEDIRLYPSVKRALADIAATQASSPQQVEFVEMMLNDLDSQKGSVAGVLDMPGAAHALSFQSVPGKSHVYARLDVHAPPKAAVASKYFDLTTSPLVQTRPNSGHWPLLQKRSASIESRPNYAQIPKASLYEPAVATPQGPTQAEIDAWVLSVQNAFNAAVAAAAAKGKLVDRNLIHVHDYRTNAQPMRLGPTVGGGGSDEAGWWVDVKDVKALAELRRTVGGAKIHLPTADNLYELPGPRWYRPWSPQVVLYGIGKSFKFGFDGRYRSDGYLKTRQSGELMVSLAVGSNGPVHGRDLIANPEGLFAMAGLPTDARALVGEALLLDTESANIMAGLSGPVTGGTKPPAVLAEIQKQFQSAVRGIWMSRDEKIRVENAGKLDAYAAFGELPSAVAMSPWKDPTDPLFLDCKYEHLYSSVAANWTVEQDRVDLNPGPGATNPPAAQVKVIEERTRVTAAVSNVLASALVTRKTIDAHGNLVKANRPPQGVTADTFTKMDIVSAPLTSFDAKLYTDHGMRERSGALRLKNLDLVDMYGLRRPWEAKPADAPTPADVPKLSYWTELTPRLPYWSRVHFRLQSSADPTKEANPVSPPVCGILLPDFIEHALEVFDGNGKALGQLTSDRARFGVAGAPATTLRSYFKLHPWMAAELNVPAGANHVDAIANPVLRSLVASLVVQSFDIPAGASQNVWYETGLTGMLRVIDTVRGTLDPTIKTHDRKVKLLGEPILVIGARLHFEGTPTTNPSDLAKDPPVLNAPPALPVISIRIGDVTRPDDGVLGFFIAETGKFAPVSKEAAEKAILNGLASGLPFLPNGVPVLHPFVKDQTNLFHLPANTPKNLVILTDVRGGLYCTSGVLPRKKITLPKEFIEAALKNMEPTFRVGPVMTFAQQGAVRAIVPPPEIEGLEAEFVYRKPAANGAPETFPETPVSLVPPIYELPKERTVVSEGWIRVFQPEE